MRLSPRSRSPIPASAIPTRPIARAFHVAREVQCWASIAALIGIAERFWNRDSSWRPMLTEAVFPFYIIHQTVIILVEYWLKPLNIGPVAEFAILVPATVAGCWAFYLIGREIGWLRPLIGLRREARAKPEAIAADSPDRLCNESRAVRPPRPGHSPPFRVSP
jgi:hypothetical protein